MCITKTYKSEVKTMWQEGTVSVNGEIFHYWMKQYEEGSEYGINGGRIS